MASADDYEALRALIHEYCYRIDAGDLDGVAELFTHAELGASVHPSRLRGAAEARTNYAGVVIYEDGTPHTMHCITNISLQIDDTAVPRTATGRSYFTVQQSHPDFVLQPIIAGQYRDKFACVDGSWRFAERIIHPDRVGDLSRHLVPAWSPPRS